MPGPSWLGIGAQRSGTDWIARLLCQHPQVDFGTNGKKEQFYLQLIPDGENTVEEYLGFFPDDGILRGDWSPLYGPSMIVPHIAKCVLQPGAPLFMLLRDPVERFASGLRHSKRNGHLPTDFNYLMLARAHQFGHYAAHLDGWASVFPRDRFVILTYEEVLEDETKACEIFWRAMGLDPHPLEGSRRMVKPSTVGKVEWNWPEGSRDALVAHYLPGVRYLRDAWGVDVHRWRSFQGLLD